MKRLIAELEVEHPDIKNSMIRALANVGPRHLLDRRLHPVADATRLMADRPDDGAMPLQLLRR
jgi:hypothetical protein